MESDKIYLNKNLQIIFSITLMAVLGISSITPAFPDIIDYFGINKSEVGLLITAFTLPGIVITPFMGILADRYGRKVILIPSLVLFALAGSVIVFLDDFTLILVFRFLQGMGSASLGSLNATIISDLFHGRDRVSAMGVNSSVLSIGTAAYPAIGGSIALLGWKFVFFLPLLALPVAYVSMKFLDTNYEKKEQHLKDYLKETLSNILKPNVIVLFIASIVTFIILFGAYLIYFPILLNDHFDASSFDIGVMMSLMSLTTAGVSFNMGRISKILTPKNSVITGFLLYGISLLLLPLMPNYYMIALPVLIFGFAQGINMPSLFTLIADYSPKSQRAAFMSINGTVLRIGQTLGPVLTGWFYAAGELNLFFVLSTLFLCIILGIIFYYLKH